MLKVRTSHINGRGCFTLAPVKKRGRIGFYAGEVVRNKREITRRIRSQERDGVILVISLHESLAIDAAVGGNETQFINHSCQPNAFMQIVGQEQVMFFALRDIAANEEITINYRDPNHPPPGGCRCGASTCRSRQASE